MSWASTIQSKVLVGDTKQLCTAWLLCQLATSESGSYDAGVTCVSRVIILTLHWSVLTVYLKRKPPASVYAVRNEQGFRTPGVFSCNAFSFRSCPVISHADVNETYKRTGRGRSWPQNPRWLQDCAGDPERIGALRSSFLSRCYEH